MKNARKKSKLRPAKKFVGFSTGRVEFYCIGGGGGGGSGLFSADDLIPMGSPAPLHRLAR